MKRIYFICFFSLIIGSSFAQKLPDIQSASMIAPTGIRIDGKSTEWNDVFAAENRRTEVFYTLANDDKNLYLILKSANSNNTNKIMLGGVTFTINAEGKKREKEGVSITYPLINRANRNQGGRTGQGQNRQGGQGGFQNRNQQNPQQRDSIALVARKAQLAGVKEIRVTGFKSITDSLISIYNEYGIKAVANFNQKGEYVYELAIPLSLIDLKDKKEFVYQLKLSGLSNMSFGGFGGGGNFGGGRLGAGGGNNSQDLMSPTDFWGKYILIKQ
ncbi:hypothetical protein FA048_12100 [Pedobacter polaris]|uniref:Uncharacterized protein n=1 Tax=Pedobacter polaris TaxID=2571273 RepID=A0A4U1CQC5_9SPHI|nr:hypothetical protein [Pedobacter polaris]TKC07902.1 hypothetical protein FA048_12100 [Pedobacter polaris]